MIKIYVFTMDFTVVQAHKMHQLFLSRSVDSNFFSQKDSSGYFQHFISKKTTYLGEPLEIHSYKRTFFSKSQVDHAIAYGCLDLKRFYGLVNELKSKEKIYTICRVRIHGGIGNTDGFEIEEIRPEGELGRAFVQSTTIGKIILNSLPFEARTEFTTVSPMNIHLISCSAGSSKHYLALDSESLASSLVVSLLNGHIYSKIQASTTTVVSPLDYYFLELQTNKRVIHCPDFDMMLDLVYGEYYYRRGVDGAIAHLKHHLRSSGENRKRVEHLEFTFRSTRKDIVCVTMLDIINNTKLGYKLIYEVRPDLSISVSDYVNKTPFISCDIMLEAHRDVLLKYFWLGYFYSLLSETDIRYAKFCLPISITEINFFIDQIEIAKSRSDILALLEKCEKTLTTRWTFTDELQACGKEFLNFILMRHSFFEKCSIQRIMTSDLKNIFANPRIPLHEF